MGYLKSHHATKQEAQPLTVEQSAKSLRHKSMTKYISGYITKYFYDFMRNKSFSSDLVFSSFSSDHGILIRDKHFNRVSIALIEFKTLRGVVHMFCDDDVVVLEKKDKKQVAGVFIIGDLTMVVPFKFYS